MCIEMTFKFVKNINSLVPREFYFGMSEVEPGNLFLTSTSGDSGAGGP